MRKHATMTSRGRITIPAEVRKELGLESGDQLDFILDGNRAILRPVRPEENPFAAYAGVLGDFEDTKGINTWIQELRDE